MHKDTVWMLRNGAFSPVSSEKQGGTPSRFTLWGVVNITPDSFFDGGRHPSFESAFSQRYPHACREWKTGRVRMGMGPCPMPGDPDLRARWEDLRSVSGFAWRVFAGFILLFFALLGRMLLFGPYE